MSDNYFLFSKSLKFRKWSERDLNLALKLWGNNEVTRYIGGPFDLDQIKKRLSTEVLNQNKYNTQYWPIFLNKDDTFIGCCGLRPYKLNEGTYEIGIHLCIEYWGKGYAKEATKTVIIYAFDKLNVKKLFAGHNPENNKSKVLLSNLGFQYLRKEFYEPTGLYHPSYELSYKDYQRKKKQYLINYTE
jgi:[ribosomal protein S5]-alanine N-acetyltransferase